jgi:hypothetical protein
MADVGVFKVIDHYARVSRGIAMLAETRVMVGVPSTKTGRREGDVLTNAELLYLHEHGFEFEAANGRMIEVPARPTLRPGIASVRSEISEGLAAAGRAATDGNEKLAERMLHRVGLIGQNAVRRWFVVGDLAPLSEATLAGRRRRGRKGTRPLIDTGQLRAAITYVLRKAGAAA